MNLPRSPDPSIWAIVSPATKNLSSPVIISQNTLSLSRNLDWKDEDIWRPLRGPGKPRRFSFRCRLFPVCLFLCCFLILDGLRLWWPAENTCSKEETGSFAYVEHNFQLPALKLMSCGYLALNGLLKNGRGWFLSLCNGNTMIEIEKLVKISKFDSAKKNIIAKLYIWLNSLAYKQCTNHNIRPKGQKVISRFLTVE